MLLNKTALARDALQAGSHGGLSLVERRVLILTDGKRTLNEVMALLGADILPVIDRLLRAGYISDARKPTSARPPAPAGVAGAFSGLLRATTGAVQAPTDQIRAGAPATPAQPPPIPAPAADPASTPPGGQRRSLVAAKMYIVDMLQLQRHPDAVELKARIQTTSGQAELLAAIVDGLRVLLQLTNQSYGQRIIARLGEVLPTGLLPAFAAMTSGFHAAGPAQERSAPPQLKVVGG